MLMTSLLTFPLFILLFTVYYDALKMHFGIHGEECVLSLVAVYGTITWIADRDFSMNDPKVISNGNHFCILFGHIKNEQQYA